MFQWRLPYLFALALLLASCSHKPAPSAQRQLTVSIAPQQALVQAIAGDKFDVQVLLPPGSNHETYEPAPRDMEKISNSEVYFILGSLDFEITWLERFKAISPGMQVVNTSAGIVPLTGTHSHGDHRYGTDPHTWLSPSCLKMQASNVCSTLAAIDARDSSFFRRNLSVFNSKADSVDRVIRQKLALKQDRAVLIFHPALGYFCRDYHLRQVSIEQDGKEPSPAELDKLIRMARRENIKAVFISKEFETRHAESIAREIGARVIVIDLMRTDWEKSLPELAGLIAEN